MTKTAKDRFIILTIWFVAVAAIAFIAGQGYGSHHAVTTVVHRVRVPVVHTRTRTVHVPTKPVWDPAFKVCHTSADHQCLWVQGTAHWVK